MDFRECEFSSILVEGVEKRREQLVGISRFIWENPEVGYEEYKASEILVNALEEGGFDITHKACGMETDKHIRSHRHGSSRLKRSSYLLIEIGRASCRERV